MKKAALIVELIQNLGLDLPNEELTEKALSRMWDDLLAFLDRRKADWAPTHGPVSTSAGGWSWDSLVEWMKTQKGGKYISFRLLRNNETHRFKDDEGNPQEVQADRFVLMDGTVDIAEVIVGTDREVLWIFTYRAQNLVHLIQGAVKHGIKIIE